MLGNSIKYPTSDNKSFDGYLVKPEGNGPFPGIVILTAIFWTYSTKVLPKLFLNKFVNFSLALSYTENYSFVPNNINANNAKNNIIQRFL